MEPLSEKDLMGKYVLMTNNMAEVFRLFSRILEEDFPRTDEAAKEIGLAVLFLKSTLEKHIKLQGGDI